MNIYLFSRKNMYNFTAKPNTLYSETDKIIFDKKLQ